MVLALILNVEKLGKMYQCRVDFIRKAFGIFWVVFYICRRFPSHCQFMYNFLDELFQLCRLVMTRDRQSCDLKDIGLWESRILRSFRGVTHRAGPELPKLTALPAALSIGRMRHGYLQASRQNS